MGTEMLHHSKPSSLGPSDKPLLQLSQGFDNCGSDGD